MHLLILSVRDLASPPISHPRSSASNCNKPTNQRCRRHKPSSKVSLHSWEVLMLTPPQLLASKILSSEQAMLVLEAIVRLPWFRTKQLLLVIFLPPNLTRILLMIFMHPREQAIPCMEPMAGGCLLQILVHWLRQQLSVWFARTLTFNWLTSKAKSLRRGQSHALPCSYPIGNPTLKELCDLFANYYRLLVQCLPLRLLQE